MGNNWVETTVGEFAPFVYGKSLPDRKRDKEGRIPVYGSNGVVGSHNKSLTKNPTVIIGRKGTVGAVHYCSSECWPIDTTFYITNPDAGLTRYKYYLLKSLRLEYLNADSAVPGLNRNAAHATRITIPVDKCEQRAIAHILGTLDDKIELNRQMSQTLEQMAQALFKSWFIDFDPVVHNAVQADHAVPERFQATATRYRDDPKAFNLPADIFALFPDRFEDSELGEIPAGWRVNPIGEAVRCVGGATPSTKVAAYWEGGTNPFLTPKDMSSLASPIITDTARHITDAGVEKISSGKIPVGSVLLSSRAPIGYLGINTVPVSVNQGIIAMICDGLLPKYYVLLWVKANMGGIKAVAGGTTFPEISKKSFKPIPVLVPSSKVLDVFSDLAGSFFEKISENVCEINSLARLRDSLLPKLVSGELSINNPKDFLGDPE